MMFDTKAYMKTYYQNHKENFRKYGKKSYLKYKSKIDSKRLARQREHIRVLNAMKNRPCTDCAGWFEPCQMDWDHVRGIKYLQISQLRTRQWKTILEEIAKCELVCANCHRLRTNKRGYPWLFN